MTWRYLAAFREVRGNEVSEVLRCWLDGGGLRTAAERAGWTEDRTPVCGGRADRGVGPRGRRAKYRRNRYFRTSKRTYCLQTRRMPTTAVRAKGLVRGRVFPATALDQRNGAPYTSAAPAPTAKSSPTSPDNCPAAPRTSRATPCLARHRLIAFWAAGQSLQEYVLERPTEEAQTPTLDGVLDRAGGRVGGSVSFKDAVTVLRVDRDLR